MCHTRELAFQISKEYERFSKYMPTVKAAVFFGGLSIKKDEDVLKKNCPHIVVGTPGRILALIRNKSLILKNVKHFILDECDKMLEQLDTLWLINFLVEPGPMEVFVDDETKLTLHGLQQYYCKLKDSEKNRKLFDLLDVLEFNQVVIFVKSVQRCVALSQLLVEQNFPAIAIHRGMAQEERLSRYQQFKDFQRRILVATNLFGRGMDIERVNIVFNYDMPEDSDTYLHRGNLLSWCYLQLKGGSPIAASLAKEILVKCRFTSVRRCSQKPTETEKCCPQSAAVSVIRY
ncbi:UNVERIFIED_CONTAM: hypothetical protein FKN15_038286 [Acipenser sinensis]